MRFLDPEPFFPLVQNPLMFCNAMSRPIACCCHGLVTALNDTGQGGNVSAPGARRASFWTRAPLVAF